MRDTKVPLVISMMYCLDTEQGHILSYNMAFGAAVHRLGWEHTAAVRSAARVHTIPNGWTRSLGSQKNHFRMGILLKAEKAIRMVVSTSAYLRSQTNRRDRPLIIFMEWFNVIHLAAFCLALPFVSDRTNLWLWMLYRWRFNNKRSELVYQLIHTFIKLLMQRDHITLFSESDISALALKKTFGQEVFVLPMPQILTSEEVDNVTKPPAYFPEEQGDLVCIWPGQPANDKGLRYVQQLLACQIPPDMRIRVAVDVKANLVEQNHDGRGVLIRLQSGIARKDYVGWLKFADFTLVPYEPSAYADRTSGVFADALAAGSIPITVKGNWIAYELSKYNLSELIIDWTRPDLVPYLYSLRDSPELRTKLHKMRSSYADTHSIEGYSRALQKIVESCNFPFTAVAAG